MNWINRLVDNIAERTENFGAYYTALGWVGLIGFPLYFLLTYHFNFPARTEYALRLTGIPISLLLIFHRQWPARARRWLPTFWYFSVLYFIPFFMTVFTFNLAKLSPLVTIIPASAIWVVLLVDSTSAIFLFVIGTILGIAYLSWTSQLRLDALHTLMLVTQYVITAALTLYFAQGRLKLKAERDRQLAIRPVARNMAQELRTPFATIRTGASGIDHYLPALLETYKKAKDSGMEVPMIRDSHINALTHVVKNIDREAQYGNVIIDLLLMQVGGLDKHFQVSKYETFSMHDTLKQSMDYYPLTDCEKSAIHIDAEKDFQYLGNENLMMHVYGILLKYALHLISQNDKGDISISLQHGQKYNRVHFIHTACGMTPEAIPKLFNTDITHSNDDGSGLAFCKTVTESFGGGIRCQAKIGKFTEFVMRFPKFKQ